MSSDGDIASALEALTGTSRYSIGTRLDAPKPRGAKPAQQSSARNQSGQSSGGDIASPLTEQNFSARENYQTGYKSSDGLFTLPAVKKIVFTDANGKQVVMFFAQP